MTLYDHAAAISAAIAAAAADGFFVDNGNLEAVYMDLNRYDARTGRVEEWVQVVIPRD